MNNKMTPAQIDELEAAYKRDAEELKSASAGEHWDPRPYVEDGLALIAHIRQLEAERPQKEAE